MAENYTEDERKIRNKLMEYRVLRGQLRRYLKRLSQESLEVAKEKGLMVRIDEDEDFAENCKELFKLAKDKFPSLYRRCNTKMPRYVQLERELIDARKELTVRLGF